MQKYMLELLDFFYLFALPVLLYKFVVNEYEYGRLLILFSHVGIMCMNIHMLM